MTARRTLTVFVDELAIEDGAIPPPRVGSVTRFALSFSEIVPPGLPTTTIRATLDADRPPPNARPHDFSWSGLLRGDGWTASWNGERPRVGLVELTGWFRHMYDDHRGAVRGNVTRIRVVTAVYRASSRTPLQWELTGEHRVGDDVEAAPRFFDRGGLYTAPGDSTAACDGPIGVLIDLDLDDVPPLPPRPRVVPGDVSACGDVVWVLDRDLPLLVRIDADHAVTEHLLPGPVGYVSKHVHATPSGCWVVGADGAWRCTFGEPARLVDERPVTIGAVHEEMLLVCRPDGSWTLHLPDGDPRPVDAPNGYVSSVIDWHDGFLAVVVTTMSNAQGRTEYRLVRVSRDGEVEIGPVCLGADHSPGGPVLGGEPVHVVQGEHLTPVMDDLGTGETTSLSRMHFGGGRAGRLIWTVCHPSDRPGRVGRWTEPGPDADPAPRQFWQLELHDPTTLTLERAVPVFTSQPAVAVDGRGNVWVVADGLRRLVPESDQLPTLIDLPSMLSER